MDATPLNLARPEVSIELAALVGKMMAKEPARRFQEPREVAQALTQFIKKGSVATAGSLPEISAFRVADEGRRSDVAPRPKVSQLTEPARPESQWESLIDVRETETSPIQVTSSIPKPGRKRPRWFWPSVAAGIVLLGLVVAWAAGLFKVTYTNGVIALEFNPRKEIRPFNGKDFQGWEAFSGQQVVDPSHVFRIDNGELVWNGNPGRIFSDPSFSNFVLKFEYLLPLNGNRKIALCRLKLDVGESYRIGHSNYRVGDVGFSLASAESQFGNTGDIVPLDFNSGMPEGDIVRRTADAARGADVWNAVEVRCEDRVIQFFLNGQKVNQVLADKNPVCHAGFNSNGTDIRIRKIVIVLLDDTNAVPKNAQDCLLPGTVWTGQNIMNVGGGRRTSWVTMKVLERSDSTFKAEWVNTNLTYGSWKIQGKIQDGEISWLAKDVEHKRGNEKQGYDAIGTIQGEEISLRYNGTTPDTGNKYESTITLQLNR
jgi:hypothetical protein